MSVVVVKKTKYLVRDDLDSIVRFLESSNIYYTESTRACDSLFKREKISVGISKRNPNNWQGMRKGRGETESMSFGKTRNIAGLRCYILCRLGEIVRLEYTTSKPLRLIKAW